MTTNNKFRNKALSRSSRFNYLPDNDRYLMAPTKPKYRFNIIGSGIFGQEHIHATHLEGRATIHGVYDPNPRSIESAKAVHSRWSDTELVIYDSLEAACNDPAVDALIISTPNHTHLDVVKEASKSGKHILLEKPISNTIPDALTMVQLAESYNAVFQVGLQYRYKPINVEAMCEIFERKTIGDVKLISIQAHRIPFLDKVNQWNKFAKYSGDTLIEECCHYFDLINLFAKSRPMRVFASGNMAVNFTEFEYDGEQSDILDNAFVIIDYENGIRANFSLCMFAPMHYEDLIFCGDEGRLRAWEQSDFLPSGVLNSHLEIMCGENKPSRRIDPAYPSWIEESGHSGATYFEHVYFIDNIEGKPTNTASAREGLWSIIVAGAAQEAIKTNQAIIVNEYLAGMNLDI